MTTQHTPERLIELYQDHREGEVSEKTLRNNWGHLRDFREWCESNRIDDLRDLSGLELQEFRVHLKQDRRLTTVRNHVSTVRTFLRWLNRVDVLDEDLSRALEVPDVPAEEKSRDTMIEPQTIERLFEYFERFEYAKVRHVALILLWHTGCRMGSLRALDLDDYVSYTETNTDYGFVQFRHRPETGTPLKNGKAGERKPYIRPDYCKVVDDFIEARRPDVEDEHGRQPLIAHENGRYHENSFQAMMYAITRPCHYTNECPHDRVIEDCEAARYDTASKCPSSVSPHPIRRGSITYHLREKEWGYDDASQRFDVSVKVLKQHYDRTTEDDRRDKRASQYLTNEEGRL
jgi:site-specific recombinase XerD